MVILVISARYCHLNLSRNGKKSRLCAFLGVAHKDCYARTTINKTCATRQVLTC
jgi:hypothetical protein